MWSRKTSSLSVISIFLFLGFCSGQGSALPLTNQTNLITHQGTLSPLSPLSPPSLSNQENQTCTLCTDIVNIIDAELHIINSSISIIENVVKLFCHTLILPSSRKECYFILDNIQNIVNWLVAGRRPKQICYRLGLCPKVNTHKH